LSSIELAEREKRAVEAAEREWPHLGQVDRHGATVPTECAVSTAGIFGETRQEPISLSTVMQRFKSFTTYEYGKGVRSSGWPRYPGRLWQHRFYEHVIRNERELDALREYIANNPLKWHLDRENPDRVNSG
jgi:hypothetical protein